MEASSCRQPSCAQVAPLGRGPRVCGWPHSAWGLFRPVPPNPQRPQRLLRLLWPSMIGSVHFVPSWLKSPGLGPNANELDRLGVSVPRW